MNKEKCIKLFDKGKGLYKKGKYRAALSEFSKMEIDLLGNYDESLVHHFSALCHAKLARLSRSIKEFKKALKYNPNYSKIHLDLGLTYYYFHKENKVREFFLKFFTAKTYLHYALKAFEAGIIIDSENAQLWYYRGYMLQLIGKDLEAMENYKKAKKLDKKLKNLEKSRLFDDLK
ncbi:hypothetical protein GOV09_00190 [Candidatus Woesearchaeota archaeon]|nr:hypothetical protein [Candidatus Woesearchaeota archaeon]